MDRIAPPDMVMPNRAGNGHPNDGNGHRWWVGLWWGMLALGTMGAGTVRAAVFQLPTANRTLLHPGQEAQYFVGTVARTWESGTFGCVRTDGWQLHEGLDIRCVQRDRRNEPTDPVLATANGQVVYINSRASLSAYGIYVVLRHRVAGLEIYSLYAHLSRVQPGLHVGQSVQAGQALAIMGRTANTRQRISRERAHVHFELALLVNENYPRWHRKTYPKGVNDHGVWNGLNLVGLDPQAILLAAYQQGRKFDLLNLIRCQTELFRVLVRDTDFPWLRRYAALVQRNPVAAREGVAGYEISFNFTGVPFHLVPRARSEISGRQAVQLLWVNAAEYKLRPCSRLVVKHGHRFQLSAKGLRYLDLLTF